MEVFYERAGAKYCDGGGGNNPIGGAKRRMGMVCEQSANEWAEAKAKDSQHGGDFSSIFFVFKRIFLKGKSFAICTATWRLAAGSVEK